MFDAFFFGHDDGLRSDAVTAWVLAGFLLAFDGLRACATLSVGAIGCQLLFGYLLHSVTAFRRGILSPYDMVVADVGSIQTAVLL